MSLFSYSLSSSAVIYIISFCCKEFLYCISSHFLVRNVVLSSAQSVRRSHPRCMADTIEYNHGREGVVRGSQSQVHL